MKINFVLMLVLVLISLFDAIINDLLTYRTALKADPSAQFNWKVALPKYRNAVITGVTGYFGFGTVLTGVDRVGIANIPDSTPIGSLTLL